MEQANHNDQEVFDAEVIDSSVIDESVFRKVLLRAGRSLAKPALEAFEMILDTRTPPQARVSLIAALTYLIMPIDLMPDFIPVAGFSDDLVALTAVISLWSQHMNPEIRNRARRKLDRWFPL
ncbi:MULTISPECIES: YkvA family protein [Prochlorococcus]|uniref:Uncharacterized conserved protein n=1 Tax=Prochlorococcus marinus (strain SARG / CCMP1375 / SS120) TaxID=167539 RepID=Q7VD10_PROMA|nr:MULTISPECIES: DUF1232 domain-containing protein [Prochlorococcus]AAP99624.1 Uncharacterized conserved protein [Prochlorococcus marinus subsp. marinus str. CCMP1375]KGG11106.1 hypothetical protein EV04_1179 [Prochlorococcus marinus str. LG]KGG21444.1 hypothetical protein EV08_0529 [Prochlorococcus marinus str. SS2]KGG23211.1 hypothetical protein EV09_1959 [Prochlorococcus marinus str. SS35]KGG33922.1 hypothetical protein EV10_0361 [Prochlorococcus marinus str. SS51]